MEGERKKRKMEMESENQGEDDEEKMEKFFALIRSTREVRDRLKGVFKESKDQKEEKRVEQEIKGITVWNPTFQPEDFIGDNKSSKSTTPGATQPGPSKNKGNEEEDGNGLDLNLSL